MSQKSKQELAEVLRPRYQQAGRAEKSRILDEFGAATGYHRKYANFFQPVMMLVSKERQGAKVTKRYDAPKTPYQCVLAAPDVTEADKTRLRQLYTTLNPAALLRQIRAQQVAVWKLALKAETE